MPAGVRARPERDAARGGDFDSRICVTGQHAEMLGQVLEWFGLAPDYDLKLMTPNQTLAGFASRALVALGDLFEQVKPDVVLVQGDTTTVMIAALAAFYQRIPVGHVEAGLRTHNRYEPFPEEINRRLATDLSTYHFAPTSTAAAALLREHVAADDVFLTGNTVIDALLMTASRVGSCPIDGYAGAAAGGAAASGGRAGPSRRGPAPDPRHRTPARELRRPARLDLLARCGTWSSATPT